MSAYRNALMEEGNRDDLRKALSNAWKELDILYAKLEKTELEKAVSERMWLSEELEKTRTERDAASAELVRVRARIEDMRKANIGMAAERDAAYRLLRAAYKRIYDCKHNAMFSSKDSIVKHVAELLPRIDAQLEKMLPKINVCVCERSHNGIGLAGRECDCPAGVQEMDALLTDAYHGEAKNATERDAANRLLEECVVEFELAGARAALCARINAHLKRLP